MEDESRPTRMDRGLDRVFAIGRRIARWGRELARNPIRLLTGVVCIVLLAVALPLLIGGGNRLMTAWNEWRHDRAVGRDWVRTNAFLDEVRANDGLQLRLSYFDRSGDHHTAEVQVESTGLRWLERQLPIRYDPNHPSQVDLVGVAEADPLGSALIAGASVGAGLAALLLALAIWRRRRALAETRHPMTVLRMPLAVSAVVLLLGMAAWAVGTVQLRGWTGVADRLGHHMSVAFGDLLGIIVPLVAFVIGCLLAAWLARHRDYRSHTGFLASVHRLIDRAANFVPSPEDLAAHPTAAEPDAPDAAAASEPAASDAPGDDAPGDPAPNDPDAAPDETDPVRTW